jgi:hypothetical protein
MKTRHLIPAVLAASAWMSGSALAAEVYGGNGIGFSNGTVNPSTGASPTGPWVANIVFNRQDVRAGASPAIMKTGDNITHPRQAADAGKNNNTMIVPTLKSMSWCDDTNTIKALMSPEVAGRTESGCYGWSMHNRWVVLDLNALQRAGLTNVWVSITAMKYSDGVDDLDKNGNGDDDLVPALTVFQGRQDQGVHLHWFPSQFQQMADFWAWKLKPFQGGTTQSNGWATAYLESNSQNSANVTGRLKLRPGGDNYLTVSVGGDAKHKGTAAEIAKLKHDVNFELSVRVSRSKPASAMNSGSGGGGTSAGGSIDKCGCQVGVTQWHASMNHCMAVALCEPIAGTADQCKTPAMCERDGGR